MGFRKLLSGFFSSKATRRQRPMPAGLNIESLEQRVVLYATSGNAWANPEVITISFQIDGTNLGGVYSDMNQVFNSNPNLAGVWQSEILRAAQAWTQATNINFVVVSDSGVPIGSGSYVQGSPTIGDIRIGGFNFGNTTTLAQAVSPPQGSNYSIAGDIQFNTAVAYNVGTGIDLYTVAVHEIGHALGLNHSAVSSAQMFSVYNGVKSGLAADDTAGIRAIYSNGNARSADSYDGAGSANNTIGNASNITGPLRKATKSGIYEDLDITTTSDVDFYKINIPAWAGSTMTVKAQSTGLSMLAPKMTIYAENQTTVLGTITGGSSSTVSLAINGIHNNDQYFIKIEGAPGSAFNTGAYGITIDLGAETPPVLPLPNTMVYCSTPYNTDGFQADTDSFGFEDHHAEEPATPAIAVAKAKTVSGTADAGTTITIYDDGKAIGTATTSADGTWVANFDLSAGIHVLTATATDASGLTSGLSDAAAVNVKGRKR